MADFGVILPAAGKSGRFRDKNYKKPFAPLAGRAVWLHAAERFMNRPDVRQLVVVVADEDREEFDRRFGANVAILGLDVVAGGANRAASVKEGLSALAADLPFVAVHDAARPCLADAWVDQLFDAARREGSAILAIPVVSTLKRVAQKQVVETIDRRTLWEAQTPQAFRRQLLVDAYAQGGSQDATDEAQLVEQLGQSVSIVTGSPLNIKITTRQDLKLAEQILKVLPKPKTYDGRNPLADNLW